MSESKATTDSGHGKQLHVYIDVQTDKLLNKKESKFNFFKKRKDKEVNEVQRPASPVLPLVKFDSQGDFTKEVLETDNSKNELEEQVPPSAFKLFLGKYFTVDYKQVKHYCKVGFKFLFSQIGLLGLVIGYVVVGALIFMKIESSYEKENQEKIEKNREDFYANVKLSAEVLFNEYLKKNFHTKYNQYRIEEMRHKDDELFHDALESFNRNILNTTTHLPDDSDTNNNVINFNSKKINMNSYHKTSWNIELDKEIFFKQVKDHLSHLLSENDNLEDKGDQSIQVADDLWNFSNALLYAATVITTIGYGNITPKSSIGKIFTIFYAMIGIPLMFMCLTNTGDLLAEIFISCYTTCIKFITKRLCKHKLKMPYSATKYQENKQEILTEFENEYDNPNDRHVPIVATLGVLIAYIIGGAFIFAFTEGWSILDGVYFCFITFTTIGNINRTKKMLNNYGY